MSILERCPSYRESNKRSKERQGPTLGVRFTEVSVKRESTVDTLCYDPNNSLCTATPLLNQNPRLFLGETGRLYTKNEKEKKNDKSVSISLLNALQKI